MYIRSSLLWLVTTQGRASTSKMDQAANLTPAQKNELIMRVRSEVQAQALQELTQNLQEKCFDKCITNAKGKLDGKQQNCLALCINRYIDTMKVVSEAMVERGPQH